jgi:hypothetical protein
VRRYVGKVELDVTEDLEQTPGGLEPDDGRERHITRSSAGRGTKGRINQAPQFEQGHEEAKGDTLILRSLGADSLAEEWLQEWRYKSERRGAYHQAFRHAQCVLAFASNQDNHVRRRYFDCEARDTNSKRIGCIIAEERYPIVLTNFKADVEWDTKTEVRDECTEPILNPRGET